MPCRATQDGWIMVGEFWQNVVHWRREWQTTSVFLPWEPYESRRRGGWQRMRWLDGITDSMDTTLIWTPGVGDGQGGLACCDSLGRKESDTTERLNWTELNWPWEFMFDYPIFFSFHTVHGVFKARILKWFTIPFSTGTRYIRTLHHDLSILGGMAHSFIELDKAVIHLVSLVHFLWLGFSFCLPSDE